MKTIWKGRKPIDWLEIFVTGERFVYPEPLQQQVEEKRDEVYEREVSQGKKVWDSDMYRVDEMILGEEKCTLQLGIIKWSMQFVVKMYPNLFLDIFPKYFPNGIACGTLVETNDGNFVFGVRNVNTAGRVGGEKALIGGALEPSEGEVTSWQGFYDHILRELNEEVGVTLDYMRDAHIVGIQRMKNGGIGFIYYISLTCSSEEVKNMFSERTDDEMADVLFIDRNEVIDFLTDYCYEHGKLIKPMGLCIEYIEEIFSQD